jgi:hypothetical protein
LGRLVLALAGLFCFGGGIISFEFLALRQAQDMALSFELGGRFRRW